MARDVINHEWRQGADGGSIDGGAVGARTFLKPRFIQGCSFHFMQPAGVT